jgi:DNA-binding winged helix-turn-helix (wHTH) protein
MPDGVYRFLEFSISPSDRRLFQGEQCLSLPPKAFDALHLLVRHHGSLVQRAELVTALWPGTHVTEANLTNIIVMLRKLLGREAIQTVSKFGYRFTLPVTGEPGVKQAAYASFVRGKELLSQRSFESIAAARECFWIALADDPNFAPAWAWLGRTSRLLEKFKNELPTSSTLAEAAFRRAFLLDPDLACAHQFYTQFQVDSGRALEAMSRLTSRLKLRGEEPETLTALVQVLRVCGLLEESVAAHERAIALDPAIHTSVAHTHFLRGDYTRAFETYNASQFYLDAACWAALGQQERAISSLRSRLQRPELGTMMSSMIGSLLAALEGKAEETIALTSRMNPLPDPEGRFYCARHCGMINAVTHTVELVRQARLDGFHCSFALENDIAFAGIRHDPAFQQEIAESKHQEAQAQKIFHQTLTTIP